ncbi:phage tail tube protein [Paracoccus lutimaris]|uniref:Uncharacterized protein n=1 Tax=Paracoccus lutimaris TaxID=1490030 RepID=A0A368YEQ7_9RHOB|nr:phage tail tube protein [Paracoccus lutimaris]RCW77816.1 hypothetical protein DFP89_15610 [Paracoccus lutimaris]
MARLFRKLAILCGVEATYATAAAITAANAVIGTNVSFTPLEAEEVNRDLYLPYLGNQGIILAGKHARLEFDVEVAGAGAAGTAPLYGDLLRICGFAETVTAGTDTTYTIVEDDVDSGTIHFEMDGVRHVLLGALGNMQLTFAPKGIPHYRFILTGLLGTITDAALTQTSLAGWTTPLECSSANTTLSLHGWASVAENLTIDLGNTVTPRFQIGSESVIISDRRTTGQAVVEATNLATINWFQRALARTRGALELVHGVTAGNIVEINGPAIEIGKISQGQTDGILNYQLPLSFCPATGRDELSIVVR